MGLEFEDDEPDKPAKKEKKEKPPARSRVLSTSTKTQDPDVFLKWYKQYIMGEKELAFNTGELDTIAKCCHDYRKSHTRAEGKDPLLSPEAKYYHAAGNIIDKIKKFKGNK